MKIFYIIEDYLVNAEEKEEWIEALTKNKVGYAFVRRIPFAETFEEAFPDCLPDVCKHGSGYTPIYYCTIEMCKMLIENQSQQNLNLNGLFFPYSSGISYSQWNLICQENHIARISHHPLFITYGHLIENWDKIFENENSSQLFIKPDSGAKLFTGAVWNTDEKEIFVEYVEGEMEKNHYKSNLSDELLVVNYPQNIVAEFRFFILGHRVITVSPYKATIWNRKRPRLKSYEIANSVAAIENKYQPDIFYTVDIAELENGGCGVLEMNAGSCSGLYEKHNKDKLIKMFKSWFKRLN